MTHSTHHPRHTPPSPNQLTLIEGTAGWRDNSLRATRNRDQARARAAERRLTTELNELRDQIRAERATLASLRKAQDTVIKETTAYAKQKRMAFDEIVEAIYDLMGTDHPNNIAIRLQYKSLEHLVMRLRRNGYINLADQLRKPLRKPPAPYPQAMWRGPRGPRKPADDAS